MAISFYKYLGITEWFVNFRKKNVQVLDETDLRDDHDSIKVTFALNSTWAERTNKMSIEMSDI